VRIDEVTDREMMLQYREQVRGMVKRFGGRYVAADDHVDVLEGEWPCVRTTIAQFPSYEAARRFYFSEEYQKVLPLRLKGTRGATVLVRGLEETGIVELVR
jgi:uncharacterized protein (DUF1330 family)